MQGEDGQKLFVYMYKMCTLSVTIVMSSDTEPDPDFFIPTDKLSEQKLELIQGIPRRSCP